MTRPSAGRGRTRRLRMMLMTVALGFGVSIGAIGLQAPALAIPPGGWCYTSWYDVQSVGGEVHNPYLPTKSFHNTSGIPVNWHEEVTVTTTFSSTYTTTTTFHGGIDLAIVKFGVDSATTTTTVITITVSQRSGFDATVPANTTMYASYGTFGMSTSGTYNQERYGCDNHDFYSFTSGALSAYNLTSVGWLVWQ